MNFSSEYVLNTKRKQNASNIDASAGTTHLTLPEEDHEDSPNTNVVTIKFNQLKDIIDMHVGDPIKCSYCDAYLSSISQVDFTNEPIWECEFCQRENRPQIEHQEVPRSEDVTFMIEAAPSVSGKLASNEQDSIESSNIIYCIDISGSMSVTTSVPGNIHLPTDDLKKQKDQAIHGEDYQVPYVRQRTQRYISRLEAVQVAIADSLAKLKEESPNRRVGLIAFNHKVHVYGDGNGEPIELSGSILDNKEQLEIKTQELNELLSINNTFEKLYDKLIRLEEGGSTALGPAILYSILIASRKQGSKVILCTDGLANKGIGSLEDPKDVQSVEFYNKLADYALDKGVSVSIITLQGTDCKLGVLGDLADRTSGVVSIVDPLNLRTEFSTILGEQIIATNVEARFLLHKDLYVKDYENLDHRLSKISKKIGNVMQETEITFEFGIRDDLTSHDKKEIRLPFQLQILYTAKDGTKALRVLTKLKPITNDRKLAEQYADRTILAAHYIQSNSRFLQRSHEPQQQLQAQNQHFKWDNYIKNLKTKNNDDFSEEIYSNVTTDMARVLNAPRQLPQTRTFSSSRNAYAEMNDEDASKAYRLANFKSNLMKKK